MQEVMKSRLYHKTITEKDRIFCLEYSGYHVTGHKIALQLYQNCTKSALRNSILRRFFYIALIIGGLTCFVRMNRER